MNEGNTGTGVETMGLDVSDRRTTLCRVDEAGEIVERGEIQSTPRGLARRFEHVPPLRIVLEVGTHSPWMSRQLEGYGHEVIVANARRVKMIWASEDKSDEVDAEALARLGRSDPALLRPIRHRGEQASAHRSMISSRTILSRTRVDLIHHVRGVVKSLGARLPQCGTAVFAKRARPELPDLLRDSLEPLLDVIEDLTRRIRRYDAAIQTLCEETYPETMQMRRIRGVGAITALAFVLTIEDPQRFRNSRQVGSYLGLRPKRSQSGDRDPRLRITKRGDREMRRLLVNASQYLLGPFGEDCDLRRFGERIEARGGKAAKRRAVVAVARKLAVRLHWLWVTGVEYEPLYLAKQQQERDQAA